MSPSNGVYEKLREQLDQYSIGFPATESGLELKILRKLFTEEEAGLFLLLTMSLETPDSVAARTGRDLGETEALLEGMADKGLIFRLKRGDVSKYGAAPFVVGSYEYQLPTMDKELAALTDAYMEETFSQAFKAGQLLRPIPVNRSVAVEYQVATHEDSRQILRNQRLIAVAECICRKQQGLLDKGCGKPREVCMVFGAHAEYYIERNMARAITLEEADDIIETAEKAGLVCQPFNSINPGGMCNCCGDCCGVLRALNKLPKPADFVVSNYYADVDQELCTGCETCLERCQMGAIEITDDSIAAINLDRCIGCGLCVTTCPTEAMVLKLKPEDQRKNPPASNFEHMTKMADARGVSLIPLALQK